MPRKDGRRDRREGGTQQHRPIDAGEPLSHGFLFPIFQPIARRLPPFPFVSAPPSKFDAFFSSPGMLALFYRFDTLSKIPAWRLDPAVLPGDILAPSCKSDNKNS